MTPELTALALAGLLQGVQLALFAIPANLQLGMGYTLQPPRPPAIPAVVGDRRTAATRAEQPF